MEPDTYRQSLDRAADYCGIQQEFWDIFGHQHVAGPEIKLAVVEALGLRPNYLDADREAMELARWARIVEPCVFLENYDSFDVSVPESHQDHPIEIKLVLEDGTPTTFVFQLKHLAQTNSAEFQETRYVRKQIGLPVRLPLGYHDAHLSVEGLPNASARLVVTPERAYIPEFLGSGRKTGGIAIALYGLRSARNWGCGDTRDLRDFCEWAAKETHVSFVALNPLHAIHNRAPYNTSPYLPNSIFYQNFIYLDVEAIDDFQNSPEAQQSFYAAETQAEIAELRATPTVQYERVSALKLRMLRPAFDHFHDSPSPAFREYVKREGDLLLRFATYCALDHYLRSTNPTLWIWPDWPEQYREPDSPETLAFQRAHPQAIAFYQWIQWHLSTQLFSAQEHAKAVGLPIGLYHDLALATDQFGSDLWAHRPFYVKGARVGSPPDDFSPLGQDWGFPPPNKYHHRESGYRLFIESIRKTCQFGGALRIDHVMRFFRLYWIPDNSDARGGAYVSDFWHDLIRILALESVRNKVLIVGEDLGTVEPEVRETLSRFGILSYRLFYFEREHNGAYKHASQYPYQALVSSTTHDLPTIAGFWINEDIEARRRAGILDDGSYHSQLADRAREKQKMLDALFAEGFMPHDYPRDAGQIPELTGALHNAIIGFLTSTPSMLMVLNQEDLSKETEQQNLPGSTWQHPNWSRKMKYTIEELRTDSVAIGFVQMFRDWLHRTGRA